jgi:hypothetical protein
MFQREFASNITTLDSTAAAVAAAAAAAGA